MINSVEKFAKLGALFFVFLVSILGIIAILFYFYLLPSRLDPQGDASSSCISEDLQTIVNKSGMVASGHHTVCDDMVHDSAIYVYLHKNGEVEGSRSLIFRFVDDPRMAVPQIEWINDSTLSISVGDVEQVTKSLTELDGVKIRYSIGKEKYSRQDWDARQQQLILFSIGAFILLLVLCYVCRWILKLSDKGRTGDTEKIVR